MAIDERLRETTQRARSRGFLLLFALLLADINYRLFYLGESPHEHWDLAAIWAAGCVFVLVSLLLTGGYSGAGRRLKRFYVMMFFINLGVRAVLYGEYSPGDLAENALMNIVGIAGFAAVIFGATRLWEWRKGLARPDAVEPVE